TQVTASDVLAAQARLRRYLDVTPTHYAERFGTWLKLENLQRTGSYKVRGALNALLAARERGDDRYVITASAGNHAQGMAWAAYRARHQRRRRRRRGRDGAPARRHLRRGQGLRQGTGAAERLSPALGLR